MQKEVGLAHPNKNISILIGHIQIMNFYDIPPLQVPYFVIRKRLRDRIQELFSRSDTSSSQSIVVLFGMGGSGKTQLALEYCRHLKHSGKHKAIFWLDASARSALIHAMGSIVHCKELIHKILIAGFIGHTLTL